MWHKSSVLATCCHAPLVNRVIFSASQPGSVRRQTTEPAFFEMLRGGNHFVFFCNRWVRDCGAIVALHSLLPHLVYCQGCFLQVQLHCKIFTICEARRLRLNCAGAPLKAVSAAVQQSRHLESCRESAVWAATRAPWLSSGTTSTLSTHICLVSCVCGLHGGRVSPENICS